MDRYLGPTSSRKGWMDSQYHWAGGSVKAPIRTISTSRFWSRCSHKDVITRAALCTAIETCGWFKSKRTLSYACLISYACLLQLSFSWPFQIPSKPAWKALESDVSKNLGRQLATRRCWRRCGPEAFGAAIVEASNHPWGWLRAHHEMHVRTGEKAGGAWQV